MQERLYIIPFLLSCEIFFFHFSSFLIDEGSWNKKGVDMISDTGENIEKKKTNVA